jgi:AmmeMemoRadiSam system protein B
MPGIRPAAVAGRFYPSDPDELTSAIDQVLDGVRGAEDHGVIVAVVVPHAGYAYSAPVAASAFARLTGRPEAIRRVVVLGPAHFVELDGLAVPTVGWMQTPLGGVPVDGDACRQLAAGGLAVCSDAPHAIEHSIEVQLPFLQRILGTASTYVPVAVGRSDPGHVADVLDLLNGDLVAVSTDLSHYLHQARAQRQDLRTAAAVIERRPEQIGPRDACGHFALRGLLAWAIRHDHHVELVDLRTSADTVGGAERVVGYGAFVLTSGSTRTHRLNNSGLSAHHGS